MTHYLFCLFQDSTIEFEKRRNVPVRYDRELVQTTLKAMKRVGEIKSRREHAFWKSRSVSFACLLAVFVLIASNRMAASRAKHRAHREKVIAAAKSSVKLVEPMAVESPGTTKVREKIKIQGKARSALVPGEGRSMGMDLD